MSAASRQKTCPGCGLPIGEDDRVDIEPLIDPQVRYVVVHWACSTDPILQRVKRAQGY